jgi:hypothetical protein
MGAQQYVFAVDETPFVDLLAYTMGDLLVSLLPQSRDLADRHITGWWSETHGDVDYFVSPDGRIKLIQDARIRYLEKEDIRRAPGMSLRVRDYIAGQSSAQLDWLLRILADSRLYAFIRCIVDGERRWWIHSLLEAAEYWFGPGCPDYVALHGLCQKLLPGSSLPEWGRRAADPDPESPAFPVLPLDASDPTMGAWTTEETEEAISYCRTLLDLGAKFARYAGIGYPETEEGWDRWVRRIVEQLLSLRPGGFLDPIVVSFHAN